jgi:hypothetical protein
MNVRRFTEQERAYREVADSGRSIAHSTLSSRWFLPQRIQLIGFNDAELPECREQLGTPGNDRDHVM